MGRGPGAGGRVAGSGGADRAATVIATPRHRSATSRQAENDFAKGPAGIQIFMALGHTARRGCTLISLRKIFRITCHLVDFSMISTLP